MGDQQVRKRKEKRKKKDSSNSERSKAEAEFLARKLSSVADDSDEGIPAKTPHKEPSLNEGDSIIHVDHDHGTGGHWCAKIIFFALLGVLIGLIGLIIIENRGLTDLDTPVAESRYAQVFDGWVEEGPVHDDHHDEHTLELKHPEDEHDDHDEGFDEEHEEIEDIDNEDAHEDEDHDDGDDDHDDRDDGHDDKDDDHDDEEDDDEFDNQNDDDDEPDDHDDEQYEDDIDQNMNDDDRIESQENDEGDNDDDEDNIRSTEDVDENEYVSAERQRASHEIEDDDEEEEYLNMSLQEDEIYDENEDEHRSTANDLSKENDIDNKSSPLEEVDSAEEEVLVDNAEIEEKHLAAKEAEKLAQEQEDNGNMGIRVGVGLALLLVTYCVLARKWRNALARDDESLNPEIHRRMTLISNENVEPNIEETENSEEEEEEEESVEEVNNIKYLEDVDEEILEELQSKIDTFISESESVNTNKEIEKEDYKCEKENIALQKLETSQKPVEEIQVPEKQEPPEEIYEDEEEIEEEEIEEEEELEDEEIIEEEEIEEDISEELDDSELMRKLEEKYGKLPDLDDEPEGHSDEEKPIVPARRKPKTGGNSVEDDYIIEWDGDDNNEWSQQLDLAQAEMDENKLEKAFRHYTAQSLSNPRCWRAKYGRARALDALAEKKQNNNILQSAINEYQEILRLNVTDNIFSRIAERLIDRIRFRGRYLDAVPYQDMLIERFPDEPKHQNELAISYLMVNKPELARPILLEVLKKWPNDGVALVHYGFILKTVDNNLLDSVDFLQRGIATRDNKTLEGRFLFHLGDALARLGQIDEAKKIYKLGADLNVFLSPMQRSLYNVDRLTAHPWWHPEQTPYVNFIKLLESNYREIANEARKLRSEYRPEQENLKDTGDWSQFELFARGVEIKKNCIKCPITCKIARSEPAAWGCRRGQIKFSAMSPGTHVHAHTGPTNCRLRAHLGLQGTKNTFIRVAEETRSWKEGEVFIFDDSFEHEVWHNGTDLRIVLIVDFWHPELTNNERISLPAI